MAKTTIFPFFFLFPLLLQAQIKMPFQSIRPGDKVIKQQVAYADPGEAGADKFWDFSKIDTEGKEYILEYLDPPFDADSSFIVMGRDTFQKKNLREGELVIGIEHYTAYYYRIHNNRLTLLGFENPVNLMHYEKPLLVMAYPFAVGDKTSESYRGSVVYSGGDPLVTHGTQSIEADASGRMRLPSGDTLNVVRVRSLQTIADDARLRKADSTAINTEMERFYWYAEGFRYPVFEVVRSADTSQEAKEQIFGTAFYYPPQAHHYLLKDPDNQFVREVKNIQTRSDGNPKERLLPGNWAVEGTDWGCHFYPNPVESVLTVDYRIEEAKEVCLALYDGGGRLLKQTPPKKKEKGLYSEIFDFGPFAQGSYILRLQMGNERESKIIIKR